MCMVTAGVLQWVHSTLSCAQNVSRMSPGLFSFVLTYYFFDGCVLTGEAFYWLKSESCHFVSYLTPDSVLSLESEWEHVRL